MCLPKKAGERATPNNSPVFLFANNFKFVSKKVQTRLYIVDSWLVLQAPFPKSIPMKPDPLTHVTLMYLLLMHLFKQKPNNFVIIRDSVERTAAGLPFLHF